MIEELNSKINNSCDIVWLDDTAGTVSYFVSKEVFPQRVGDSLVYAIRSMFGSAIDSVYFTQAPKTDKVDFRCKVHLKLRGSWNHYTDVVNICGFKFEARGMLKTTPNGKEQKIYHNATFMFAFVHEDGTILKPGSILRVRAQHSDWYYGKVIQVSPQGIKLDCSTPFAAQQQTFQISDIEDLEVIES